MTKFRRGSWLFPGTFALLVGALPLKAQETGRTAVERQMRPIALGHGLFVRAASLTEGRSELRISDREVASTVELPYIVITAAARMQDSLLVAGVFPDGCLDYRAIVRREGTWIASANGVPTHVSPVAKMSCNQGRVAMLLRDGLVVTAPCSEVEDLPTWGEFEYVGRASESLRKVADLAYLEVAGADRIHVYQHPAFVSAFVRQPSGAWRYERDTQPPTESLVVQKPARIGGSIVFHSTSAGPIFLEEEAAEPALLVAQEHTSGQRQLPEPLSQSLRADKRYRLRTNSVTGAWFHPAAIAGTAWHSEGVGFQEIRILESGVRTERGATAFRTTLEFAERPVPSHVFKVALLAVSTNAAPTVVVRGNRTWLVPDRALSVEKPLRGDRRTYALSVAVPLPEIQPSTQTWVHAQLVAIGPDGDTLGATGIRSVAILPNLGDSTVAHEQAARMSASAYWAAHGIQGVQAFWERMIER